MRLDRLPRGITGFFDSTEATRSIDPMTFRRACYLVARVDGGSIEGIETGRLCTNHHAATLKTTTDHVSVLCNTVHSYLAFVPPGAVDARSQDRKFIPTIGVAAQFGSLTNFHALDADWLMSDICQNHLANLGAAELRQIRHWKPQRIGDVIFNDWD